MSLRRVMLILALAGCMVESIAAQSVSLTAPYHTYPDFMVGDSWTLTISGAATGSLVQIAGWHNGSSLGTTSYGNTDNGGSASYQGTLDSSTLGSWVEQISVGGTLIGELDFNVSEAEACSFGDSGDLMLYSFDLYYGGQYAAGVDPDLEA